MAVVMSSGPKLRQTLQNFRTLVKLVAPFFAPAKARDERRQDLAA